MKLVKKEIDFFEVEVKFLVRKGSHKAESKQKLKEIISNGIGKNEMECIDAEDIKINIKE